jgi:lipopolysaccharide/colanic/teichoic acid biosynthesis glycosyltransferase
MSGLSISSRTIDVTQDAGAAAAPGAQRRSRLGRPRAGSSAGLGSAAQRRAKRVLDVTAAGALLVLILPVMLGIAVALRLSGGPAMFGQMRVGQGGTPFRCLKFRSMVPDAEARLAEHLRDNPAAAAEWAERRKLRNDPRVTRFGAFLRATSLDELPQLLNVLRGEMSLVGPRPVVAAELEAHYGPAGTAAYIACRPGVTGLWQVSGRSDTSYAKRVALDMRYVRHWSLALDLRILLATVPAVLRRRGAV